MSNYVKCCNAFPKLIEAFDWFSFTDEKTNEKVYIMPCIKGSDNIYRINNCPSCGAYVRDVQITEKEINELS